jgi:hypothetical protein
MKELNIPDKGPEVWEDCREADRIPRICKKLYRVWVAQPDTRFGQLLLNTGLVRREDMNHQAMCDMFDTECSSFEADLDKEIEYLYSEERILNRSK